MKAIAAILAAAMSMTAASPKVPTATIDHIMLGATDLDAAMRDFEQRTGVKPQFGGVHPDRGTRNAIVSLGEDRYLEIIAPDPAQDTTKGMASELASLKKPAVVGWAVGTNDAAKLGIKLKRAGFRPAAPSPGARKRPDGVELSWVTFDLGGMDESVAPFFIQWRTADHPSRGSPPGCRLHDLQLRVPQAPSLRRLISLLDVPVRVGRSNPSRISLSLDCPKGRVSF